MLPPQYIRCKGGLRNYLLFFSPAHIPNSELAVVCTTLPTICWHQEPCCIQAIQINPMLFLARSQEVINTIFHFSITSTHAYLPAPTTSNTCEVAWNFSLPRLQIHILILLTANYTHNRNLILILLISIFFKKQVSCSLQPQVNFISAVLISKGMISYVDIIKLSKGTKLGINLV